VGALERSRPLLTKIAIVVAAGVAAGVTAGWILAQFVHLPQVDQLATFRPATTTEIVGPDGQTLASYAIEQRIELTADQIPEHLKLAIVAIEDAEFFEHGGVDPKAIARAAAVTLRNFATGHDRLITQGGSTLTQQLALNLFLKRENTLQRKIKEALLAIDIEKRYTKDQILTLYANQIFFGHGAYGVEAAARLYFNKPALALTLPEAAMIAGIIPSANNRYNPYTRPEAALQRRNKVLDRMLELGFIERQEHDAAVASPLGVGFHREYISNGAYFLEMVRKQIEEMYGTSELYTGGLRVSVTMDPQLQAIAERVVRRGLVDLEMQRLGFRRPPNVLDDGRATSPDAYQDPSWNHFVAPAGRHGPRRGRAGDADRGPAVRGPHRGPLPRRGELDPHRLPEPDPPPRRPRAGRPAGSAPDRSDGDDPGRAPPGAEDRGRAHRHRQRHWSDPRHGRGI
jgi:penicillin-binding protein 1A